MNDNFPFRISEIFASYQGEGVNTGMPAVFIRMSGCNLDCPWCDTAEKNNRNYTAMSLKEVEDKVLKVVALRGWKSNGLLAVITGGEPMLQSVDLLANRLRKWGFKIAVETNGTLMLSTIPFTHIAMTPKSLDDLHSGITRMNLLMADEIKIVIGGVLEPAAMINFIIMQGYKGPIWLQLLNEDTEYLHMAENLVHIAPDQLRIGHQMHKIRRWE